MENLFLFCFLSSFIHFAKIELSLAANTRGPKISIRDGRTINFSFHSYELGYLFPPENSNTRYLGVCCKHTGKMPDRVVWVSSRDTPSIAQLIDHLANNNLPDLCLTTFSLGCKKGGMFLKIAGITSPHSIMGSIHESMYIPNECEADCSNNCSCRDYASLKVSAGTGGCLMWFLDLNEVDKYHEYDAGQGSHSNEKEREITILVPSITSGVFVLGVLFYIIRKKTQTKVVRFTGQKSRMEDLEVPLFALSTIRKATNNFSEENLIGAGGFGSVYKGNLFNGQEIAVKKLSKNSKQGNEEFRTEAILIAKLPHKNLVALLGICIQAEERLLIYEYMKNKSLDDFIFDQKKAALLTWQKRFDIVTGIVRGLLYLHQDSKVKVIHRDLKASNILLDNDLKPKISDFGLARIFIADDEEAKTNRIIGTYGYMSPEYAMGGKFSVKSDVFSFGVLLLEIVSGKRNRGFSHPDHHYSLLGHAWLLWNEGRAFELLDSCLEDSYVESQVLRCIHVGLLCVQHFAKDRPAMSSVVLMLANITATLPEPKQPGFFTERSSADIESKSIKLELYTVNSVTITALQGR